MRRLPDGIASFLPPHEPNPGEPRLFQLRTNPLGDDFDRLNPAEVAELYDSTPMGLLKSDSSDAAL